MQHASDLSIATKSIIKDIRSDNQSPFPTLAFQPHISSCGQRESLVLVCCVVLGVFSTRANMFLAINIQTELIIERDATLPSRAYERIQKLLKWQYNVQYVDFLSAVLVHANFLALQLRRSVTDNKSNEDSLNVCWEVRHLPRYGRMVTKDFWA